MLEYRRWLLEQQGLDEITTLAYANKTPFIAPVEQALLTATHISALATTT
jgi:hypothetical protein